MNIMNDHIKKGYVERLDGFNDSDRKESWFLPHHPVINPKKPGKVRVVFDCAVRFNGVCLNDCLLSGPDTLTDLVGILLRFRRGSVAVTADIEEMFLQVKLHPSDRAKMRFLWWDNGDLTNALSVYQMTVHPFGATSSPFCANFALMKSIDEFGGTLSEPTLTCARRDLYVDDCITSLNDANTAVTVAIELSNLFRKTGFRLRRWISNSHEVLEKLPESERSDKVVSLTNDTLPIERTLGVSWDTEHDTLTFQFQLDNKPDTRRGILANVASMFDPLKLLAPFTSVTRMLLQDLCRTGRG